MKFINHIPSPSFTLPLPQVPHTHTVPILQSYLSLLISKSIFKGVFQCIPTMSILYFDPFNPFHCCPLPLLSHPPFFNSFQCISLYPLPSHMLHFTILLTCYHSLLFTYFWWDWGLNSGLHASKQVH
jgi:hypothetical protein